MVFSNVESYLSLAKEMQEVAYGYVERFPLVLWADRSDIFRHYYRYEYESGSESGYVYVDRWYPLAFGWDKAAITEILSRHGLSLDGRDFAGVCLKWSEGQHRNKIQSPLIDAIEDITKIFETEKEMYAEYLKSGKLPF